MFLFLFSWKVPYFLHLWFSSECDRCRRECSLPDHADSVSQKTAQTLQTAPETHHGVSVKSQRRSRSEVRVHSRTTENHFLFWSFISILLKNCPEARSCHLFNFFPVVHFWCSSKTRPPVTSLTRSYSWPTSLFSETSTRIISRVSWWTWPSILLPTFLFRG